MKMKQFEPRRIDVPAKCPDCAAPTCVEYSGHSPVEPFTTPEEQVRAIHCAAVHDGGQECDWRMPLDCRPGEWINLVPV